MVTFAYHKLPINPNHDDDSPTSTPSRAAALPKVISRRRPILLGLTGLALLTVTFVSIIIWAQHWQQHASTTTRASPEECGLSASEARQRGCVFDAVIMGWVPWRCYDAGLARDFLAEKDWPFYRGPGWKAMDNTSDASDSGLRMPLEEVLRGEWSTLYVEEEFYLFQCTYTWRKTWQAAMSGGMLDGYVGDSHHTSHCEMLITKGPHLEKKVYMKYASCPWVRSADRGRFGWYRVIDGNKVYRADA